MSTSTPLHHSPEASASRGAYERPLAAAWTRWVNMTPGWLLVVVGLLLLAVPLLLGLLDGLVGPALASGELRFWFLWPTLIIYTLAMIPLFVRNDEKLMRSLWRLVELDDAELARTLQHTIRFRWQVEALALMAGALSGLLIGTPQELLANPPLLTWYLYISAWVAFALLGWLIVVATTCTRLTSAFYRLPMAVNLFDISPFDPVGRQSLLIVLSIMGGTLISLLFIFDPAVLGSWQNLIIYGGLIVISVLLFFANMWPTHRLLARTKRAHLDRISQRIAAAYGRLDDCTPPDRATTDAIVRLSAELNALIAAEKRLKVTRTWPYNTEMLRTLVLSVLTPLAVGLSRLLAAWIASNS
jgi:hypothetical protein